MGCSPITRALIGPPWRQGVLYTHRSNFLHAFVVVMPDSLDLKSSSCVLAVVPMFHVRGTGRGVWKSKFGACNGGRVLRW